MIVMWCFWDFVCDGETICLQGFQGQVKQCVYGGKGREQWAFLTVTGQVMVLGEPWEVTVLGECGMETKWGVALVTMSQGLFSVCEVASAVLVV